MMRQIKDLLVIDTAITKTAVMRSCITISPIWGQEHDVSDENDILQKADALLRRRASCSEPDFPVLTEVVESPQAVPPSAPGNSSEKSADLSRGVTPNDILELERRILETMLPTLEVQLEELIRSTLLLHFSETLERALELACKEVSCATANQAAEQLSEAVKAAIRAELSKLRSEMTDV